MSDFTDYVSIPMEGTDLEPHLSNKSNIPNVLNINLSTLSSKSISVFFGDMIKCIYNFTTLHYVEYKGKPYCNQDSIWYNTCEEVDNHILQQCDSYISCDNEDKDIDNCYLHPFIPKSNLPIKYNFKIASIKSIHDAYQLYYDMHNKSVCKIVKSIWSKVIETGNMTNITFTFFKNVSLNNNIGFNYDHRGSNHTGIELDFHACYNLSNQFTLLELVDACYRIKSHKFDTCYEMYIDSEVTIENKSIVINFEFDHGS
jgi:hypothetical protein